MNEQIILLVIFAIGYAAIAFEDCIKIKKTISAIITGVVCWIVIFKFETNKNTFMKFNEDNLIPALGEISEVLFFLLCAMTIVGLISLYNGFQSVTALVARTKGKKLLWVTGLLAFFLSSVLDNLTTTLVMIFILVKIIRDHKLLLSLVSVVVIAANAGGAWTVIGDVTTTMLWMRGKISFGPIMTHLFLPSIVCLIISLIYFHFKIKLTPESFYPATDDGENVNRESLKRQNMILGFGILILLLVPISKLFTDVPPYLIILLGLSLLWLYTDFRGKKDKNAFKHTISNAMEKIDTPTILFFLGILLSIAALKHADILKYCADWLNHEKTDIRLIAFIIGLASAVVDNVPLVDAANKTFIVISSEFNTDGVFWTLLAYCAGTGGSIFIIGSAAGVAAMGAINTPIEEYEKECEKKNIVPEVRQKLDFIWYFKNISGVALLSYISGILFYLFQSWIISKI